VSGVESEKGLSGATSESADRTGLRHQHNQYVLMDRIVNRC
jgi:hypothetical protein